MGGLGKNPSGGSVRFLVDMALSPKTVKFLQGIGHEAIRVDDLGMSKSRDKEIPEYAASNDMVVVTADLDFGNILTHMRYEKPSVIILRLRAPSSNGVNLSLSSALPGIKDLLDKGSIVVIEDYRIRVRQLPIG